MKPRRLTIPQVVEQFATYYEKNPAWGDLHVVLDDGNVKDVFVQCCLDDVYKSLHNDWRASHAQQMAWAEAHKLCRLLQRLSRTQRLKLPHAVRRFVERRAQPGQFLWRHVSARMSANLWTSGKVKLTCKTCGIGRAQRYSPEFMYASGEYFDRAFLRLAENAAHSLKYAGCPHVGLSFPSPPPL
jgi:RNase P subunit RPR2